MTKYYRVRKDTFLWKVGAVLAWDGTNGYSAIEDIWDAVPVIQGEYISARIVENSGNADFFERVYQDTLTGKLFQTKDKLLAKYEEAFKT